MAHNENLHVNSYAFLPNFVHPLPFLHYWDDQEHTCEFYAFWPHFCPAHYIICSQEFCLSVLLETVCPKGRVDGPLD